MKSEINSIDLRNANVAVNVQPLPLMEAPDNHARGFRVSAPDPLRYEMQSRDPDFVGMKLAGLLTPNTRVIDVGCGTGSITELLRAEAKVEIVGVEPDERRVALARGRGLNVFQGYLTRDFLKENGPFDYAVFADVLEHLPDPAEVVMTVKEGLRPGGSIIVSVPNVAHWFVRLALLRGKFDYSDTGIMDATHLRWFTRKTLCDFFEQLGFRVTALDYTLNLNQAEYQHRRPWSWLGAGNRKRLVTGLARKYPGLFSFQIVVKATLPKN